MPKTVTLRIDDKTYNTMKKLAEVDHRPLSNFIEHAAMKYIEQSQFSDELEMAELLSDHALLTRLKRGSQQAASKKGKFIA